MMYKNTVSWVVKTKKGGVLSQGLPLYPKKVTVRIVVPLALHPNANCNNDTHWLHVIQNMSGVLEWCVIVLRPAMQMHVVRRSTISTMHEPTRAKQEMWCGNVALFFTSMNAKNIEVDWNEMAAMLSPIKPPKSLLTPEVVARIETNRKAAEVRKKEVPKVLTSEIIARIEANKQAAENRKMARELGYPNMFPPVRLSSIPPAETAGEECKNEILMAWRKRHERMAIEQFQHAENVAKKRREERLSFLQKQAHEAKSQEVFDEIDKEISFLESFMKQRYT